MLDTTRHKSLRIPGFLAGTGVSLLLAACAGDLRNSAPAQAAAAVAAARNADDLLIVDCLLPGQIRKLGQSMVYTSARQAIKTTGIDCAIRGGEYVAYDRGNYTAALRVWLPLAEAGDKTAQTYVGEIYDKGLGTPPDYAEAAKWYRKAAEQGDPRAQINYGYLYEKGLGVAKDPAAALNWYRKASGMSGNVALDTGELQSLKQEVEQHKQSEQELREQLRQTREQLEKAQKELTRRQHQAAAEQSHWQTEKQSLERQRAQATAQGDLQTVQRLEARIQQKTAELNQQRQETERLERKAEQYKQELAELNQQNGQTQSLKQEVERHKQGEESLRAQLQQTQSRLTQAEADLERRQQQTSQAQRQWEAERQGLDRQKAEAVSQGDRQEVKRLEGKIREKTTELDRQQQEMAKLEQTAATYKQQLAELDLQKNKTFALEQEVARQKGESATLRRQLEEAQNQLAQTDQALQTGKAQANQAEQKVAAARKELEREKQQAVSASQVKVEKLQAQLASRETELSRQQAEVQRLTADASRYQSRVAELEKNQLAVKMPAPAAAKPGVAMIGPKIEIIEPPVSLTRSSAVPAIKTRSGIDRAVVGRVSSAAGIASFQVNNHDEKLDDNGLFRTEVPVTRANTPVQVMALDNQGKRADIQFVFISEQDANPIPVTPPPLEPAKPLLATGEFGDYYALVIGNNDYARMPKLDTAVNDATEIAEVLSKKYGFKTTKLINANRYQVLSALSEMREKLTDKDNLFIYYAGHGELDKVNQRGHWLPIDAEPNSTANWISNVDITDILNVMSARHILVVADSCYSGTLTRSSLSQLEAGMTRDAKVNWVKTMSKKRSRTALTSGGIAPVLDAGGGGAHSVFAKAFLDVLQANSDVIDGSRLYREVAARVAYAATRLQVEQVPEYAPIKYAGHDFGDFFFVPVGAQLNMSAADAP